MDVLFICFIHSLVLIINDLQDMPSSVPVYFLMVVKILIFIGGSNNQGSGQKGASISEVKRKWLMYIG